MKMQCPSHLAALDRSSPMINHGTVRRKANGMHVTNTYSTVAHVKFSRHLGDPQPTCRYINRKRHSTYCQSTSTRGGNHANHTEFWLREILMVLIVSARINCAVDVDLFHRHYRLTGHVVPSLNTYWTSSYGVQPTKEISPFSSIL